MKVVLDTNILIDAANGRFQARELLAMRRDDIIISTVSWIEAMVGAKTDRAREEMRVLLSFFPIIETNPGIARSAVDIRQRYRLHLPDATIWATAKSNDACLLTRDTGYPEAPDIRIPYTL